MRAPGIPPHLVARLVREALDEDIGPGDVTTDALIDPEAAARAVIEPRESIVVSGLDLALSAFTQLDPAARVLASSAEGQPLEAGEPLLEIAGRARALLMAERTALNFLARLSGVATFTRRFVEAASRAGASRVADISDTRKTTPTLRLLEKRAVASGGGANHRLGLWDAVLIKDNHIDMAGGVGAAVARARQAAGPAAPIECEVRGLDELDAALEAGAGAVLLDNFPIEKIREAVAKVAGRALVEVSGGVSLETLPRIAALGADRISIGSLTHSAPAVDLTMRMETWQK